MAMKKKSNKNMKMTMIILSTLAILIGIGIVTGKLDFTRMDQASWLRSGEKKNYSKSQKCFEDLKRKTTQQELMKIMKKKKMSDSYCDFL